MDNAVRGISSDGRVGLKEVPELNSFHGVART